MRNIKLEFAARVNYVADKLGVPAKGKNRQERLGKMFGVSQESARKWLEGESIPKTETCIEMALKANVDINWFLTGRGIPDYGNNPESKVLQIMQHMDEATKYQAVKIVDALTEHEESNGTHKTQ